MFKRHPRGSGLAVPRTSWILRLCGLGAACRFLVNGPSQGVRRTTPLEISVEARGLTACIQRATHQSLSRESTRRLRCVVRPRGVALSLHRICNRCWCFQKILVVTTFTARSQSSSPCRGMRRNNTLASSSSSLCSPHSRWSSGRCDSEFGHSTAPNSRHRMVCDVVSNSGGNVLLLLSGWWSVCVR